MKKYILCLLCVLLIPFHTAYANLIAKTIPSDIVAYINGVAIPSYNINGNTGISVEKLKKYGFYVDFDKEQGAFSIHYNPYQEVNTNGNNKVNAPLDIYKTDIIVQVQDKAVPCYNIEGQTVLLIDSLEPYGDIQWHPKERVITFDAAPSWYISLENDNMGDTSQNISSFTIEGIKNKSGTFDVSGENKQYLSNLAMSWSKTEGLCISFSLYQNVLFQTEKLITTLNSTITKNREGESIQEDAHVANEHLNIYINEEKVKILSVGEGQGNGHQDYYFFLDTNIQRLDTIKSIKIEGR